MKYIVRTRDIAERAAAYIAALPLDPPCEVIVREAKSIRSLEQNAKLWCLLGDIAKQVVWYGEKLTAENWKDVLSAGLKQQKSVPGIEGGFVVLGARTSKMSIKEMSELMELAEHFGDQQQVKWGL